MSISKKYSKTKRHIYAHGRQKKKVQLGEMGQLRVAQNNAGNMRQV